jgi:ABC-type transport system involved in multi-copper enzyme maturation permease subunit
MTFLPIVARELRVAARKRFTFWVRAGVGGVAAGAIGLGLALMLDKAPSNDVALTLFGLMTGTATAWALTAGSWSTADCLSREKREGTLGLLFLTDLRGYDVVLGKLAANSLTTFYSALVLVPITAVPLLLGGVTLGEVGRMALVILNTLFFSLTLGLCVSAVSRLARRAMGSTLALLLLAGPGLPLLAAWADSFNAPGWLVAALEVPSPAFTFYTAFDSVYKTEAAQFWYSLATIHGLAWLCLSLTSLVAPRSWQDRPVHAPGWNWARLWQPSQRGTAEDRRGWRRQRLQENAYFWLATRRRLGPAVVWAAMGVVALIWAWGWRRLHAEWLSASVYLLTAASLNLLLKWLVAAEAGHQLAKEREAGTLELLLSTRLSVADIVRGERLALWRDFFWPILATLVLMIVFLDATLAEGMDGDDRVVWIWLYIGGMLALVADVVALHWVGMWEGLTARTPLRAMAGSLLRILVLPWLVWALTSVVIYLAHLEPYRDQPQPVTLILLWLGLGLAADLGFGLSARARLLTRFRQVASERYLRRAGR